MSPSREDLEALVHRYTDGVLAPGEKETLNRLLESDPEAARCFAEETLLHALRRQKCRGRAWTSARRARWLWPALAAGAAAAILLLMMLPGAPAPAADPAGEVVLEREGRSRPLREGGALHPGDRIRTGPDGHASLRFPGEAAFLEVPADSVVGLERADGGGRRIVLETGRLRCAVSPQPPGRPFTVLTPHAEAAVLGTAFSLGVSGGRTRIRVHEGRVRFAPRRPGSPPLLLEAGEAAGADEAGVSRADEVPWREFFSADFRGGAPLPPELEPAFCPSGRIDHPDRAFAPDPGIARVEGGRLRLAETRARPESMGLSILQWKKPLPDVLRVEVTLPHQPGRQLTITLGGTPFTGYRFNFQPGEHFWRGFHMDRLEVGRHVLIQRDRRDIADVGRPHLIAVEKIGTTYRAWVDGEERIEKDAPPRPPDPSGVPLTVGATFTPLEIESIRLLER